MTLASKVVCLALSTSPGIHTDGLRFPSKCVHFLLGIVHKLACVFLLPGLLLWLESAGRKMRRTRVLGKDWQGLSFMRNCSWQASQGAVCVACMDNWNAKVWASDAEIIDVRAGKGTRGTVVCFSQPLQEWGSRRLYFINASGQQDLEGFG